MKEIVSGYRVSPGQMTRDAASQRRVSIQVMDKFFQQDGLADQLQALKPEVYTHIYLKYAPQEYAVGQCADAKEGLSQAIRLTPALVNTRQPELIDWLVSKAYHIYVTDSIDYINRVFDNLPEEAVHLKAKKRSALGKVALESFPRTSIR